MNQKFNQQMQSKLTSHKFLILYAFIWSYPMDIIGVHFLFFFARKTIWIDLKSYIFFMYACCLIPWQLYEFSFFSSVEKPFGLI